MKTSFRYIDRNVPVKLIQIRDTHHPMCVGKTRYFTRAVELRTGKTQNVLYGYSSSSNNVKLLKRRWGNGNEVEIGDYSCIDAIDTASMLGLPLVIEITKNELFYACK
jgi:hypothetical protein